MSGRCPLSLLSYWILTESSCKRALLFLDGHALLLYSLSSGPRGQVLAASRTSTYRCPPVLSYLQIKNEMLLTTLSLVPLVERERKYRID